MTYICRGRTFVRNRFGRNLKRIRKSMKLNQTEFGKLLCVSRTSICNYEKGKTTPGADQMNKFIKILGENGVNPGLLLSDMQ